jgi:hypothetical protein
LGPSVSRGATGVVHAASSHTGLLAAASVGATMAFDSMVDPGSMVDDADGAHAHAFMRGFPIHIAATPKAAVPAGQSQAAASAAHSTALRAHDSLAGDSIGGLLVERDMSDFGALAAPSQLNAADKSFVHGAQLASASAFEREINIGSDIDVHGSSDSRSLGTAHQPGRSGTLEKQAAAEPGSAYTSGARSQRCSGTGDFMPGMSSGVLVGGSFDLSGSDGTHSESGSEVEGVRSPANVPAGTIEPPSSALSTGGQKRGRLIVDQSGVRGGNEIVVEPTELGKRPRRSTRSLAAHK